MKWEKKGLVFKKEHLPSWAHSSALQPTPLMLNQETIRQFVGLRDNEGVSRIGYVDLNAKNPSDVVKVSSSPILDIGVPGAFDDNGVVPSAVVRHDDKIYMFYAGYHLSNRVRFCVFSGLAVSDDGGESFVRTQKTPLFERTESELLFRVPHSVLFELGKWRFWYGGGDKFICHQEKMLPVYDVKYVESSSISSIPNLGKTVLTFQNDDEYRVARPYVVFDEGLYKMFCCISTLSKGYRLGYAESADGINWVRCDNKLGIDVSDGNEWDSQMMGYPSFVRTKYGSYLFYNGNDYGADGFGYAVQEEL